MTVEKNFLVVVYSGTGRSLIAGKPTEAAAQKHALALAAQHPDHEVYVYQAQYFAQARLTPASIYSVPRDVIEPEPPLDELSAAGAAK